MRGRSSGGGDGWANTPLVGRESELARITDAVRDGTAAAVLLTGPAGVGKTRLAEECLSQLSPRGSKPLRVLATRSTAPLPLGALAPWLPRLDVPDAMLLPAARQALLRACRGRPIVVLVDDAHHLDPVSAALIQQLVSTGQAFALLTARADESLPDALSVLWKDLGALRIDVSPLPDDDMALLAARLLGGPVDLFAGRELIRLSAGNPLALREIITTTRDNGVLRRDPNGCWRADGHIGAPHHLVDVIAQRVAGLAAGQGDALRLVALAEPIGWQFAAKLAGREALDDLERAGLITVEVSGQRREVHLAHPLFGEAATRDLTTGHRQALLSGLADALSDTGLRRQNDIVRVADWRLAAGEVAAPPLLLKAARRALALHDLRSVARFASAASVVDGGPFASFLLGYAQSRTGEPTAAEPNLATAMAGADRPALLSTIAVARSDNLLAGLADWDAAAAVIDDAERRLAATPQVAEVRAHYARMLWLHGEAEAAFDTIAPLVAAPGSRAWVLGAVFLGVGLPWDARPLEALELAEKVMPVHDDLWHREMIQFPPLVHQMGRLFSLLFAGRLDEAAALASTLWTETSRTDLAPDLGMFAMLAGFVAKERGRLLEARRWLHRSVEIYEQAGPTRLRWPLSILVEVETDGRSHDRAQRAAYRLRTLVDGPFRNMDGMEQIFLANLRAAEGVLPEAEPALLAVAERHCAPGRRTFAVYAAHELARIGRAGSGAQFVDRLRPHVQGGLLTAKLDATAAAAAADPAALSMAAQRFVDSGAWLYAAESWTEASQCLARRNERRRATRCAREAQQCLRHCEGARSAALTTEDPAPETLTRREGEIATLAASGLSSKQIGERMVLSVRTVDNHLQRSYHKLGIASRDELADALGLSCRK
jgi:DNA-binding CsgD family transcriptional regulator